MPLYLVLTPERLGESLYFDANADPVLVKISQQALIGRRAFNTAIQPGIDLTLYGAFEKGISRIHAVIRRVDDGLTIEDLGSTNGTWLNGEKLSPYSAALLKSGDHLLLGQLSVEIYFRG